MFSGVLSFHGCGGTGYGVRSALTPLPGKPKTLAIPLFQNDSYQERASAILTDSFIRVIAHRAQVDLVERDASPDAVLLGRIEKITVVPTGLNTAPVAGGLPEKRLLMSSFDLSVVIGLVLWNPKTRSSLWSKQFTRTESVSALALQLENQGAALNSILNDSKARIQLNQISDRLADDAYNDLTADF